MINATDEFKNLMKYNTNFHAYAEVTLTDGTIFTLSDEDFTVSDNSIIDGSSINSFPLGVAVQKVVRLEILNRHDEYKNHIFTGASIRLYLKYQKSTLVEQIEKGTFTVVIPETYGETIIITAYDDMYKADKPYYSGLVFPQSAGAVLRDICDNCGLALAGSFLNESFVINEKPEGTFREVIGHIAMIACGNARIDSRGYLEIVSYDFNSTPYTLEDFINLKVEANNTVITGVKMIADDDDATEVMEGTDSYVLTVSNPLAKGKEQTLVSYIYERIANIPFMPFSGEYIAHPLIEFMDFVEINDMGNTYNSFITDVNFVFAGVTSLKNTTPGALRQTSVYNSSSSKAEQLARNLVKKERNAREEAMKKLNEDVQNAGGMHTTSVEQPDGSNIIYMHDKPTLDESKNVMIITSNAVGFSTDGGETYPFGFKVDGNMIANILTAYGVSADWINTGALVVKDADGKIIFSADISTGQVIVSGDSVKIGDSTASFEIEELKKEVSNSLSLIMHMDNEYQGIPTDSDGNYEMFPDNVKTTVTVFNGNKDVTSSCVYSVSKSAGVSGEWDKDTYTYVVSGLSSDNGWVDITATYIDLLSITKRMNLSKIKSGEDGRSYVLKASTTVIQKQSGGALNPGYIEYSATYRDGQSTETNDYKGIFVIEETTDGITWKVVYESAAPESYVKHLFYVVLEDGNGNPLVTSEGLSLGIIREFESVRCTLYSSDKKNIVDTSTATVFKEANALTHEDVFKLLTNDGAVKGIYKEGDQIYISFTYAKGGELALGGKNNGNGLLTILDADGKSVGHIDNTGVHFEQGSFTGTITSGKGEIAGWTITEKAISSVNNLIKLIASGAIELTGNGYIKFGETVLTTSSNAMKVDGGLWVYNGTDAFSDGSDQMKFFNLPHVSSGGHLVFGTDGSTVSYLSSSSKRYKEVDRVLTREDVEKAFDVGVFWAKYKDGYLSKTDPMDGKYIPMLMAEDIEQKIPTAAVYRNGQIEDWNERVMIPMMIQMIKELKNEIELLKAEVR